MILKKNNSRFNRLVSQKKFANTFNPKIKIYGKNLVLLLTFIY